MELSEREEAVLDEYRKIAQNVRELASEIESLTAVGEGQEGPVPLMAETLRGLEVRLVLVNQLFKAATYSVLNSGEAQPK